ncbi:MAG: hypothetical protein U9P42_02960 [Candidatus Fermentibacteria bacterium]|nr:hypothetical protein [Candidatus Fermentibacteria bacterium]
MLSFLIIVVLALFSSVYGMDTGEETALRRLAATTDILTSYEDELVGEPVSGMLLMRDTVSIDLSLNSSYIYEIVVWTESSFNFVDFWVTNPSGSVPVSKQSDHVSFPVTPYSTESRTWNLQIELLDAANSDTAYYAFALLRRSP